MKMPLFAAPILAALLLLPVARSVSAADLFPSDPGTIWHYTSSSGQHDDLVAGELSTVNVGSFSYLCRSFTFAPGSAHAGITELLEFNSGGVRLVGVTDATGVGGHFLTPLWLAPPAVLYDAGPQVLFTSEYPVPSGSPSAFTYTLEATTAPLTVPAGTFGAVWGTMRALFQIGGGNNMGDVWAAGVGCLEYQDGEIFQLVSVDGPTPASATTWGAMKRRYR